MIVTRYLVRDPAKYGHIDSTRAVKYIFFATQCVSTAPCMFLHELRLGDDSLLIYVSYYYTTLYNLSSVQDAAMRAHNLSQCVLVVLELLDVQFFFAPYLLILYSLIYS